MKEEVVYTMLPEKNVLTVSFQDTRFVDRMRKAWGTLLGSDLIIDAGKLKVLNFRRIGR